MCGSKQHATEECPHRGRTRTYERSASTSESSGDDALFNCLAWAVGIIVVVAIVVWLVVNIVVPVALLNSALLLTLAAVFVKRARRLLAWASLAGGCYLLADIFGGWLADDFVQNIIKDRRWITAFVAVNSMALGASASLLIHSAWARADALRQSVEPESKRRGTQLLVAYGAVVVVAVGFIPALYFSLPNSLDSLPITAEQEGASAVPPKRGSTKNAGSPALNKLPSRETRADGSGSSPAQAETAPPTEGVWRDPQTTLLWAAQDNGRVLAQSQAVAYCESLVLAHASDWRLPGIDELAALYRPELQKFPKIAPPLQLGDCCLWSADLVEEADGSISAWYFNYWLHAGERARWDATNTGLNARALCVRKPEGAPAQASELQSDETSKEATQSRRPGDRETPGTPAPTSPRAEAVTTRPEAKAERGTGAGEKLNAELLAQPSPGESVPVTTDQAAPSGEEPSSGSPGRLPGSVTRDSKTSLIWTKRDNGSKVEWEEASSYCDGLELAGFTDWRLPSLAEVADIYIQGSGSSSPMDWGTTRLDLDLSTCCVWTSTLDKKERPQFFSRASGKAGRVVIKAVDLKLMRAVCVRDGG